MKKLWPVAVLAFFVASASAQETDDTGTAKVVFEKKVAYPFEGEVAASRLNVRMFPKANAGSIIASVLPLGAKVTVVGERESFYQILAPRGCTAWTGSGSKGSSGVG